MKEKIINNICVIGAGYVGLVVSACLSDMGNYVICVDEDKKKIDDLNNGIIPIFEPGLEELIISNRTENRLSFSSDINSSVLNSDICFIAVNTPSNPDGSADCSNVFNTALTIANSMNSYKLIVNKSTVPVGTTEEISKIIKNNSKYDFDVVFNPEFLKQGNAVEDFLHPDRIIIGSDSDKASSLMRELYSSFFRLGERIIFMDIKSAEITKYAANSFLASRISFMNEIGNLCEKTGANVDMVRSGIASDSRIGNKYLFSGIGYGGSCLPKDVRALIKMGEKYNVDLSLINSIDYVNNNQIKIFLNKITNAFENNVQGKTFAIWGLSYKPKTNDMREAPSIPVINELLNMGAKIKAYDPKALNTAKSIFADKISYCSNSYETLNDADALILLTEWNEFRRPDFKKVKSMLKTPIIFDARNQYNAEYLYKIGFKYYSFGKS